MMRWRTLVWLCLVIRARQGLAAPERLRQLFEFKPGEARAHAGLRAGRTTAQGHAHVLTGFCLRGGGNRHAVSPAGRWIFCRSPPSLGNQYTRATPWVFE